MRNHFHLIVETPNANLVAGMRWLLSAFTLRLNLRHKLFRHVFSKRYQAISVEASSTGYLRTAEAWLVLGQRGIQGEVARADGGPVGQPPFGGIAPREHGGEGRADYRRRVETAAVERNGLGAACENASGEVGAVGAAAAGDDPDDSRDRRASVDGQLEEPEQPALFHEEGEEQIIRPEASQKRQCYSLTRFPWH